MECGYTNGGGMTISHDRTRKPSNIKLKGILPCKDFFFPEVGCFQFWVPLHVLQHFLHVHPVEEEKKCGQNLNQLPKAKMCLVWTYSIDGNDLDKDYTCMNWCAHSD